ncbi:T9SS type A sorting domain-containing protein [Dyadobacter sp. 32]|uniref:T9SS type A sorting domain-containing protein n=1 Tax=Dyadobacter sp. 32 TaxID=538966 RepID=UPI0011EE2418
MKKHLGFLTLILALLVFNRSYAQDVSINITNTPSIPLGSSTPILVTVCNEDPSPVDAPANKLRPQISVPGNVTITGATNTDGSALTDFTVLSTSTGNGNTIILLLTTPLVNGECKSFHVIVQGMVISGNTLFNATLGFQGPQTPGNITGNDNSPSGIAVTAAPPVTTDDMVTGVTPGAPIVVSVLTNDTPGTSAIDITTVQLVEPGTGNPVTSVTIPGQGTYTVDVATGVITFTPIPGFSGTPTPVDYTVKDVNGLISNPSTITVTVPLPVTLISFEVRKEGGLAQLNWATTEETNSDRFEIERSVTGKNWNRIGTVVSHGESNTRKNYHFVDASPVNGGPSHGENLYRLKMVDKDETFAYSSIRSLKFEGAGADLSIYPNPIVNQLFIRDASQVTQVVINDLNGRTVHQSGSTATGFIDVKGLSAGMYIVRVSRSNGLVSSHKVVVSR